jgi:hypothetical protein
MEVMLDTVANHASSDCIYVTSIVSNKSVKKLGEDIDDQSTWCNSSYASHSSCTCTNYGSLLCDKFYGRHDEKAKLLDAYRRVGNVKDSKGSSYMPELILVKGETVRQMVT